MLPCYEYFFLVPLFLHLLLEHSVEIILIRSGQTYVHRNVWFQKISIPLPRKVFGLHPPTPSEFPFQGGLWWPPSPQEFPHYANMVFVVTFTPFSTYNALLLFYTICMFAIRFEMFYVFHENLFKPSVVTFYQRWCRGLPRIICVPNAT